MGKTNQLSLGAYGNQAGGFVSIVMEPGPDPVAHLICLFNFVKHGISLIQHVPFIPVAGSHGTNCKILFRHCFYPKVFWRLPRHGLLAGISRLYTL